MQLKWLEDLQALAQTRSFTRAAELCYLTQPAFGRRIKALEAWVGAPLIQRPAFTLRLDARRFNHLTVASGKLVPVSRTLLQGRAAHAFVTNPCRTWPMPKVRHSVV